MRKLHLLLGILLLTITVNAQINTFDLSSYKLPDIKRHQLDINAGFDGGNKYYDSYQRLDSDYTEKSNGIGGDFGIGYRFYRNSENYQGNQYVGIGLRSDYSDERDEDGYVGEELYFSNNFQINSNNRFYMNNKFFLESDLLFTQYYSKSDENYDLNNVENINKDLSLNVRLGLGYGRIEEVQDAWLATYILKDLQENGKLTRTPTNEEILEFSSLISQLKNERFFDARLQKIKEIEEVDKFLQSKNLIENADARYFTAVNDNWDNAATQIRTSGNRLSFLIIPYIKSSSNFYEIDNLSIVYTTDRNITEYKVQALLILNNAKPIDLHWQRSFSVSLSGNYMKGLYKTIYDDINNETEISSPQLISMLDYIIKYYPNSRTNLSMGAYINFKNYFGKEEIDNIENDINHLNITPGINFSLNYYISPQLMLDASYNIYYDYTESNSNYYEHVDNDDFIKRNQFNQSISIGFKYQIF